MSAARSPTWCWWIPPAIRRRSTRLARQDRRPKESSEAWRIGEEPRRAAGRDRGIRAWFHHCDQRLADPLRREGCDGRNRRFPRFSRSAHSRAAISLARAEAGRALVPRSRIFEVRERSMLLATSSTDPGEIARIIGLLESSRPTAIAISLIFGQLNPVHERGWPGDPHPPDSIPIYLRLRSMPRSANMREPIPWPLPPMSVPVASYLPTSRTASGATTTRRPCCSCEATVASPPGCRARQPGDHAAFRTGRRRHRRERPRRRDQRPQHHYFRHGRDLGGFLADLRLPDRLAAERVIDEQVLRVDMLDIATISAGGGSIHGGPRRCAAWGRVAGSRPGPVCYGLAAPNHVHGCRAILGILDRADFAGGQSACGGRHAGDRRAYCGAAWPQRRKGSPGRVCGLPTCGKHSRPVGRARLRHKALFAARFRRCGRHLRRPDGVRARRGGSPLPPRLACLQLTACCWPTSYAARRRLMPVHLRRSCP